MMNNKAQKQQKQKYFIRIWVYNNFIFAKCLYGKRKKNRYNFESELRNQIF